jgi:hypothetical protein
MPSTTTGSDVFKLVEGVKHCSPFKDNNSNNNSIDPPQSSLFVHLNNGEQQMFDVAESTNTNQEESNKSNNRRDNSIPNSSSPAFMKRLGDSIQQQQLQQQLKSGSNKKANSDQDKRSSTNCDSQLMTATPTVLERLTKKALANPKCLCANSTSCPWNFYSSLTSSSTSMASDDKFQTCSGAIGLNKETGEYELLFTCSNKISRQCAKTSRQCVTCQNIMKSKYKSHTTNLFPTTKENDDQETGTLEENNNSPPAPASSTTSSSSLKGNKDNFDWLISPSNKESKEEEDKGQNQVTTTIISNEQQQETKITSTAVVDDEDAALIKQYTEEDKFLVSTSSLLMQPTDKETSSVLVLSSPPPQQAPSPTSPPFIWDKKVKATNSVVFHRNGNAFTRYYTQRLHVLDNTSVRTRIQFCVEYNPDTMKVIPQPKLFYFIPADATVMSNRAEKPVLRNCVLKAEKQKPHNPSQTYTHRVYPLRILQTMCNKPNIQIVFFDEDYVHNESGGVGRALMHDFTKAFHNYMPDPTDDTVPEEILDRIYMDYIKSTGMIFDRARCLQITTPEEYWRLPKHELERKIKESLDPNCKNPPIPRAYIVCQEDIQSAEEQIRYWTGFPDEFPVSNKMDEEQEMITATSSFTSTTTSATSGGNNNIVPKYAFATPSPSHHHAQQEIESSKRVVVTRSMLQTKGGSSRSTSDRRKPSTTSQQHNQEGHRGVSAEDDSRTNTADGYNDDDSSDENDNVDDNDNDSEEDRGDKRRSRKSNARGVGRQPAAKTV